METWRLVVLCKWAIPLLYAPLNWREPFALIRPRRTLKAVTVQAGMALLPLLLHLALLAGCKRMVPVLDRFAKAIHPTMQAALPVIQPTGGVSILASIWIWKYGYDGEPLWLTSITHEFHKAIKKLPELPKIRFHDIRHSHATQLLAAGIHPKIAQERLGHSTITTTLDLYSHAVETMQDDAAAKLDSALRSAIKSKLSGTKLQLG